MRDYRFRGKRLGSPHDWVYGDLVNAQAGQKLIISTTKSSYTTDNTDLCNISLVKVLPDTVGQFTGLYDADGKEIWEGDVLLYGDEKLTVYFDERTCGAWLVESDILTGDALTLYAEHSKVIGNIYVHDAPGGDEK